VRAPSGEMMSQEAGASVEQLVGACLFLGIDEVEPGPELEAFLADLRPSGVILFARNVQGADQLRRLNRMLRGDGPLPRLVGVDQEGGRVERLRPVLGALPSAAELAREGAQTVREYGRLLGAALRALGFNLNFAPVLDLSSPGADNGIGDRAFGDAPDVVGRLGGALLEGLGAAGVLGVVKHFPGLGPTRIDSHQALPRVDKPGEDFLREDLRPFRETLARAPAVLVGHAHYPFLDADPVPATCSRAAVTELLRDELGYRGAAITDDLEMGAVDQGDGWLEAGAAAVRAGCDLALVCRSRERMRAFRDHLVLAVRRGTLPRERLEEAARRSEELRRAASGDVPDSGEEALVELRRRFGSR